MTLKEYIEQIEGEELKQLSIDLFSRNGSRFLEYLPRVRNDDLEAILFKEFENLPQVLINKVLKYSSEVLESEVCQPSSSAVDVIRTILRFSVKYENILDPIVLLKGIDNMALPESARLDLAVYFASFREYPETVLESRVEKFPFLLPALLSKFKRIGYGIKALETVNQYIETANLLFVQPRITDILHQMLDIDKGLDKPIQRLRQFLSTAKPETVHLVKKILSGKSFGDVITELDYSNPVYNILEFRQVDYETAEQVIHNTLKGIHVEEFPYLNAKALAYTLSLHFKNDTRKELEKLGPVFHFYDQHLGSLFHESLYYNKMLYYPDEFHVQYHGKIFQFPYTNAQLESDEESWYVKDYAGERQHEFNKLQELYQQVI